MQTFASLYRFTSPNTIVDAASIPYSAEVEQIRPMGTLVFCRKRRYRVMRACKRLLLPACNLFGVGVGRDRGIRGDTGARHGRRAAKKPQRFAPKADQGRGFGTPRDQTRGYRPASRLVAPQRSWGHECRFRGARRFSTTASLSPGAGSASDPQFYARRRAVLRQ